MAGNERRLSIWYFLDFTMRFTGKPHCENLQLFVLFGRITVESFQNGVGPFNQLKAVRYLLLRKWNHNGSSKQGRVTIVSERSILSSNQN